MHVDRSDKQKIDARTFEETKKREHRDIISPIGRAGPTYRVALPRAVAFNYGVIIGVIRHRFSRASDGSVFVARQSESFSLTTTRAPALYR